MSEQEPVRATHAMDQDSWIQRHKVLAAFLVVFGGFGGGLGAVYLLGVLL